MAKRVYFLLASLVFHLILLIIMDLGRNPVAKEPPLSKAKRFGFRLITLPSPEIHFTKKIINKKDKFKSTRLCPIPKVRSQFAKGQRKAPKENQKNQEEGAKAKGLLSKKVKQDQIKSINQPEKNVNHNREIQPQGQPKQPSQWAETSLTTLPLEEEPLPVPLTLPVCQKRVAPVYPWLARKRNWAGIVQLKALIGKKGEVVEVEVLKSSGYPLLDEAAVKAVRKWRYQPALRAGQEVEAVVRVRIPFVLED